MSRELTKAIIALTKEVKRFNDAHEPPKTRPKAEAELFRANFNAEEVARQSESERLSQLHPAEDRESARAEREPPNQRRTRPQAPRIDRKGRKGSS